MKSFLSPKKVTPRDCSPERRSRLNQRVWRINRMSIVSQSKAVRQFRCRVIADVPVYEQIIPTAGGLNNYQPIPRLVVEAAWKSFYSCPVQSGVN